VQVGKEEMKPKFRALNRNPNPSYGEDAEKWFYGNYFDNFTYGDEGIVDDHIGWIDNGPNLPQAVDPKTLGMFTGIEDKNGKDIYGGDILADGSFQDDYVYWKAEVYWNKEGSWYIKDLNGDCGISHIWACSPCTECEVIGNIHQKMVYEND